MYICIYLYVKFCVHTKPRKYQQASQRRVLDFSDGRMALKVLTQIGNVVQVAEESC